MGARRDRLRIVQSRQRMRDDQLSKRARYCPFVWIYRRSGVAREGEARVTDPWASTDALGESLHFLRMSGVFYIPR